MIAWPTTSRGFSPANALALGIAVAALVVAAVTRQDAVEPTIREPAGPESSIRTSSPAADATAAALAELGERLDRLEASLLQRRAAVGEPEIESVVRRVLAEARAIETSTGTARSAADEAACTSLLRELLATEDAGQRADVWDRLRAAGGVDLALAYFERRAQQEPGSADAQTEFGNALVQKMLAATDESERIALGKRIEAQYDRALELQPDHWEARFRKAVGLSFAPSLSGRQSQAVAEFEHLVAQQDGMAAMPGQESTYVYLGRLYEQRGESAKASAIWHRGLSRHPGSKDLIELTTRR